MTPKNDEHIDRYLQKVMKRIQLAEEARVEINELLNQYQTTGKRFSISLSRETESTNSSNRLLSILKK